MAQIVNRTVALLLLASVDINFLDKSMSWWSVVTTYVYIRIHMLSESNRPYLLTDCIFNIAAAVASSNNLRHYDRSMLE
jgi:hypothetical protein